MMKQICLNCKRYRPEDECTGRCRLARGKVEASEYPVMKHEDHCRFWQDAGQQYFIRAGWLKNMKSKAKEGERQGRQEKK